MVISVAIDPERQVSTIIEEAQSLSVAFDEPIHVIHVMSESEANERRRAIAKTKEETIDEKEEENIAAQKAKEAVGHAFNGVVFVGRVGNASDEILKYVDEIDARYLLVEPRKRSPAGKAIFGSVAQDILLNSSIPVITVLDAE